MHIPPPESTSKQCAYCCVRNWATSELEPSVPTSKVDWRWSKCFASRCSGSNVPVDAASWTMSFRSTCFSALHEYCSDRKSLLLKWTVSSNSEHSEWMCINTWTHPDGPIWHVNPPNMAKWVKFTLTVETCTPHYSLIPSTSFLFISAQASIQSLYTSIGSLRWVIWFVYFCPQTVHCTRPFWVK